MSNYSKTYTPQDLSLFNVSYANGKTTVKSAKDNNIRSIALPRGVSNIDNNAFENQKSLTSADLPEGLISIGSNAFKNCSSMKRLSLPTTVKSIGSWCFDGCAAFNKVEIKDLPAFCRIAFSDAGANPLKFGHNLYLNGELLTELHFPEGITEVAECGFYACDSLRRVYIPDGVTAIKKWAFWTCKNLEEIYLPRSLKSIGFRAFWECSSLKKVYYAGTASDFKRVEIGEDNPVLKNALFVPNFTGLPKDNEKTLEDENLYRVGGIEDDEFNPDDWSDYNADDGEVVLSKDGFSEDENFDTPLSSFDYSGSSTSGYTIKGLIDKSLSRIVIPKGTVAINDSAFKECSNLTCVVLPEGLASIGQSAFYDCYNLSEIYIPTTVKSIGSWCFNNCKRLLSVHIRDLASFCAIEFGDATGNPTANGASLYMNGDLITHLDFPKSVRSVGECGIYNCHGIKSVFLHSGVKKINNWGFWTCHELETVFIPSSVTAIGKRAFWECNSLKDVCYSGTASAWKSINIMEDNPQLKKAKIHYRATEQDFRDMLLEKGLVKGTDDEVVLSKDGFSEGDFYGQTPRQGEPTPLSDFEIEKQGTGYRILGVKDKNIARIVIPESVTEIKANALDHCKNLQTVIIPDTVKEIPSGAFKWCKKLREVHIGASVKQINASAFEFCPALKSFSVDERNPHFKQIEGNLYSKDGKTFVRYAEGLALSELVLPRTVTKIGKDAFSFTYKLHKISLPNGVTEVGDYAFCGCYDLKEITLPDSVTRIGTWCFKFCRSLKLIRYRGGFFKWFRVKKREYAKPFLVRVVYK